MVQRTISVDVTGEAQINRISEKITKLRDSVNALEKNIKAGLKSSALSFKVKLDTTGFYTKFGNLKKDIDYLNKHNSINISVKSNGGSNSTTSIISEANKMSKALKESIKQSEGLANSFESTGVNIRRVQNKFKEAGSEMSKVIGTLENELHNAFLINDNSAGIKSYINQLKVALTVARTLNGEIIKMRRVKPDDVGMLTNANGNLYGVSQTQSGYVSYAKTNLGQSINQAILGDYTSKEAKNALEVLKSKVPEVFPNTRHDDKLEIKGLTDYLNALEQIQSAIDGVTNKLTGFISKSVQLGAMNPFKAMLNGATALSRQIVSMNTSLAHTAGGVLKQGFLNAFNYAQMYGSRALSSLTNETQELGDAMVTYRNNMRAMDVDDNTINRNLKEMGDFGKATVYNAGDLLNMLSTYKAYGMDNESAKNLSKGMAGLVSNQSNSTEALSHASAQLNDILVRGNVSQADLRVMKSWFNPLASAKVQERLEALAQSKGYETASQAITKKQISAEELQQIITEIGYLNKTVDDGNGNLVNEFQQMVNNIATPRQAVANLKETLANLFAYDKITVNEDGSTTAESGALGKLYTSTASFIKGISDLIGTPTFEKGVTQFGNDIAKTIDSISKFGSSWNTKFSVPFINGVKSFYNNFKKAIDDETNNMLNRGITNNISRTFIDFMNLYGTKVGSTLSDLTTQGLSIVDTFSKIGSEFVRLNGLDIFTELAKFFNSLGNVALDTGAVNALIDTYKKFYTSANAILDDQENINGVEKLVTSYKEALTKVFDFITYVGTQTNAVPDALETISYFLDFFGNVTQMVKANTSVGTINGFTGNIKSFVKGLLDSLDDIYAQLISSVISAGSTPVAKRFFQSVSNFITTVHNAILNALRQIGGGSVQGGIETVMRVGTFLLDTLGSLAMAVGNNPLVTLGLIGITKFGSNALSLVQTLVSVSEAVKLLKGGGTIGEIASLASGAGASAVMGEAGGVASAGALGKLSGMSLQGILSSSWKGQGTKILSPLINKLTGKSSSLVQGIQSSMSNYASSVAQRTLAQSYKGMSSVGFKNLADSLVNLPSKLQIPTLKANALLDSTMVDMSKLFNGAKLISTDLVKGGTNSFLGGVKALGNFSATAGKNLINSASTLKGSLITAGVDIGASIIDGMVQNSNASKGIKQASSVATGALNIGASTLSGVGMGSMFGVPGMVIGGVAGLASGIWGQYSKHSQQNQQQKAQLEEAKRLANAEAQASIDIIKYNIDTLAENSKAVRTEYLKSLSGYNQDSLGNITQYLQQQAYNKGTDISGVLNQLGVNIAKVPAGIEEYFVNLNGEMVNFGELKQRTGLSSEQLLGALNLLGDTVGTNVTQLYTSTGELAHQVETFTKEQQDKNQTITKDFISNIQKAGFLTEGLEKLTVGQVEQIRTNIQTALSQKYETKEDKANAIKEAITSVTGDLNGYLDKVGNDAITSYAQAVEASATATTGTPEEKIKYYTDELTKKFGDNKKALEEKLKELEGATVEEYQQALQEMNFSDLQKEQAKVQDDQGATQAKLDKLTQFQSQLKGAMDKVTDGEVAKYQSQIDLAIQQMNSNSEGTQGYEQAEGTIREILSSIGIKSTELQNKIIDKVREGEKTLAQAVQSLNTKTEVKIEDTTALLQQQAQAFFNAVTKQIDDGKITLDQGVQLLQGIDISGIDTSKISNSGKELYNKTKGSIDNSAGKLNEGAGQANVDVSGVSTAGITNASGALKSGVINAVANAQAKLEEARAALQADMFSSAGVNSSVASNLQLKSGGKFTGGLIGNGFASLSRAVGGIIPAYHSKGLSVLPINWRKRATDTVPTMLTPGEFVLRKQAVDSIGVGLLRKMNNQGVKALQNVTGKTIINNIYNTNNAKVSQNIDNKSQYLNGMAGLDRLMRYV